MCVYGGCGGDGGGEEAAVAGGHIGMMALLGRWGGDEGGEW